MENIINLSSAVFAHSMISVSVGIVHIRSQNIYMYMHNVRNP